MWSLSAVLTWTSGCCAMQGIGAAENQPFSPKSSCSKITLLSVAVNCHRSPKDGVVGCWFTKCLHAPALHRCRIGCLCKARQVPRAKPEHIQLSAQVPTSTGVMEISDLVIRLKGCTWRDERAGAAMVCKLYFEENLFYGMWCLHEEYPE